MTEFRDGNIISIRLRNFQTFSDQTLHFGPFLNLIAAPNGSGKSTIANAIAFVFNGGPKTIGKSKSIQDFIMFGKTEASIDAEVSYKNNVITFTRHIKENKNYYYINFKLVTAKVYMQSVFDLGIDVNNLCTFLPQERVSEFCRMEATELLMETLESTNISLEKLYALRKNLAETNELLEAEDKKKAFVEKTVSKMEAEMEEIREREADEEKIAKLIYKKEFILYDQAKSEYLQTKKEADELTKLISSYLLTIEKIKKRIYNLENDEALAGYNSAVKEIKEQNKQINQIFTSMARLATKIGEIEVDIEGLIRKEELNKKEIQSKEQEIVKLKEESVELKNQLKEMVEELKKKVINFNKISEEPVDISEVWPEDNLIESTKALERCVPSTKFYDDQLQKIQDSIRQVQFRSSQLQLSIDELEQKKVTYSEQNTRRMELLKKYHYDTFKAVNWLRENKGIFSEEVIEPAFLHITINQNYTSEIETLLNFQALSSFLVKNQKDFITLTKNVKDQLNLSINVAEVSNPSLETVDRNELRRFNIDGVASDFIEGRSEYLNFFNAYSHFNTIPISKNEVNESLVLQQIKNVRRIVAGGVYSEIKRSRYGSDFIIISNTISPKGLFKHPKIEIDDINFKLKEFNKERENNKKILEGLLESKQEIDLKKEYIKKEFDTMHIEKLLFKIKSIMNNIKFQEENIINLKMNNCQKEIKELKNLQKKNNLEIEDLIEKMNKLLDLGNIPKVDLNKINDILLDLENDRRDLLVQNNLMENYESSLKTLIEQMKRLKQTLKEKSAMLKKYGTVTGLEELPDGLFDIDEEIRFLSTRVELSREKTNIKKIYEGKENDLNLIKSSIEDVNKYKEALIEEEKKERSRISSEVCNFLSPVNEEFSKMFARFGFEGKIVLDSLNTEWALNIMVKFREREALERLTSFRQSGGEKSLSTILFLLSLQKCQPMPFRLVDEINQGMDAVNERMVYEILKDMSSHSQFFIITPKLIDNVSFGDNTNAIILYSAVGMTKDLENYVSGFFN